MDENFHELERDAFEAAFKGDEAAPADAGYGLDPRQADTDAMAEAFDSPDVAVGDPAPTKPIAGEALPGLADEAASVSPEPTTAQPAAEAAKPEFKTFGQAFKYHREQAANGGPKVFEWNGKQFTTQLKSEATPKKPKSAGQAPAGKPAAKPAAESLAHSKGREYTEAWQAAEKSGSYADKLAAKQALKIAEDAAESAKEGTSVVVKRNRPNATESAIKAIVPDPTSTEYANVGGKRFFGK